MFHQEYNKDLEQLELLFVKNIGDNRIVKKRVIPNEEVTPALIIYCCNDMLVS
jgi:hypothetical protein